MDILQFLQIICYMTAVIVPAIAFYSAYRCWKSQALSLAARYPVLAITALLYSMASFVHGCAEQDFEAVIIAIYGSVVYMYCLMIFFRLCTARERQDALRRLHFAGCYLIVVISTSMLSGVGPFVCAAAGWAAASAPFIIFFHSEATVSPHPAVCLIKTLHGTVWAIRKIMDQEDLIGASQSVVGAFCFLMLIVFGLSDNYS